MARFERQRSLQNFTSSQTSCHFFRHVNGRPHVTQSFSGRCCFFTPLIGWAYPVFEGSSSGVFQNAITVAQLSRHARHDVRKRKLPNPAYFLAQAEEARVANAGATGFPLNLFGLLRSELDLGAGAHPTAGDGTKKILPTEMTTGGFMFVRIERRQAGNGHPGRSVKFSGCASVIPSSFPVGNWSVSHLRHTRPLFPHLRNIPPRNHHFRCHP